MTEENDRKPREYSKSQDRHKSPQKKKRKRIQKPRTPNPVLNTPYIPMERTTMRLNKFIANAGICSRREADGLITNGLVSINGEVVKVLGTKVEPTDVVTYKGKKLSLSSKVYLLLNKPKDYITTTNDPENRRTVMELVNNTGTDRVFPVGRLDRNTTGVLLFTNDGELMQNLIHPSANVEKVYSAVLDKALTPKDLDQLVSGVTLEDGEMHADRIALIDHDDKRRVGIEIHSGRNRIIHRMFEHLGYKVLRLDRVLFAGLDKRNLKRGDWRFLNEKEIRNLRNIAKIKK